MIQVVTYDTCFKTPETVRNREAFLMHVYACVYIYKIYIYFWNIYGQRQNLFFMRGLSSMSIHFTEALLLRALQRKLFWPGHGHRLCWLNSPVTVTPLESLSPALVHFAARLRGWRQATRDVLQPRCLTRRASSREAWASGAAMLWQPDLFAERLIRHL